MTPLFFILTVIFIVVSAAMVLIILVQRPSGGGLAGAFGGAGGGGTDTVFGGRVGDALTWATIGAFSIYMVLAVALNLVESSPSALPPAATAAIESADPGTGTGTGTDPATAGETFDPASTGAAPVGDGG